MSRDAESKLDPKAEPKTETRTARLYDKRTVDRNIKKGLLSRKDYEKFLKSLDDVTDKGVFGGPENEPAAPSSSAAAADEGDLDDDDIDEDEDNTDAEPDASGSPAGGTNSH